MVLTYFRSSDLDLHGFLASPTSAFIRGFCACAIYKCYLCIPVDGSLFPLHSTLLSLKIYIVIENRADSDVMPPVFSLSKYPIEYLTLDT